MDKDVTLVTLPIIGNIEEARNWASEFTSIITAGPRADEVQLGHPDHLVVEFNDTTVGKSAPTYKDVAKMIEWGADKDDLLVHCHAGMSRSTATAWGISIARGVDPEDAFISLRDAQPFDEYSYSKDKLRAFIPNTLIVKHLEKMFNVSLLDILYINRRNDF